MNLVSVVTNIKDLTISIERQYKKRLKEWRSLEYTVAGE